MKYEEFENLVWQHGKELYREMPWRDEPSFYHVLVSEIMLQQTQVPRVLVKFAECMKQFPSIEELAAAKLADVLRVWQGLGYNRRAKYLHETVKQIVATGQPNTLEELVKLPGVGKNTAAAIMNYVYEVPTAFVETNIRTVYFHHFFQHRTDVTDKEVREIVEATIDREHPREWFWALMDYGSALKSQGRGSLDRSKHYKKQPPLAGSVREMRGRIVRALANGRQERELLAVAVAADDRFSLALNGLIKDGLVTIDGTAVYLTS